MEVVERSSRTEAGPPAFRCDTHTHVFGPQHQYSMDPMRHYTPHQASVQALRQHLQAIGMQRVVLVQPSVYGFDNQCLLDALAELGDSARGVAVAPRDVSEAQLKVWHAAGVRAIRVNLQSSGNEDVASACNELSYWSERVCHLGWSIQLYMAYPVLQAVSTHLSRLPGSFVLDHFAMVPFSATASQDDGLLLRLAESGCIFVKLSAPYRLADAQWARAWARHLVSHAPHGVLWGSDWPHTARDAGVPALEPSQFRTVPAQTIQQDIGRWLMDEDEQQQVLVKNPARLFGWASG